LGRRVLIAEDEPHLVESLTFILEREGYEVVTAPDGEAALEQLLTSTPDLVILDVMLPKLNGLEVLKKIRDHPLLKTLPVIVLTAKGQRQDRETALSIGANLFMTKPFANNDVVEAVNALVAT
jgi:DNA-binding response OmpR family regulator